MRYSGLAQMGGVQYLQSPQGTLLWHGIVWGMVSGSERFHNLTKWSRQLPHVSSENRRPPKTGV